MLGFFILPVDFFTLMSKQEIVINLAKKLLGRKYKYGAKLEEAPRYFDCSSFACYLFKQVKINLPRCTIEQIDFGKEVSLKEIQPADLIFVKGRYGRYNPKHPNGVGHVGIYIGNDWVIHASSKKRKNKEIGRVIKTSLKKFLKYNLRGIRRVIDFKDQKILLHTCCGICAIFPTKLLKKEFKEVILFFYNPNIWPKEEYQKRLEVAKKVSKLLKVKLIEGNYEPEKFEKKVASFPLRKEGEERCQKCYLFRLIETAKFAKKNHFNYFASTLSVSPLKPSKIINQIGKEISKKYKINFFSKNFKEKNGYQICLDFAKRHHLYRQNYCGCKESYLARFN